MPIEWTYNNDVVEDIPYGAIGFVYLILFQDGTKYIGKKLARTTCKMIPLKKGKKRKGHIRFTYKNKNGKRVPQEIINKELPWKQYCGSADFSGYKNNNIYSKEIISFHATKKGMSYKENKMLYCSDTLSNSKYRNSNIGGTFYPCDVEEIEYHNFLFKEFNDDN